MTSSWPDPPDQEARNRIAQELDRSHFVQAGAGSGKTTQIITRVIALVCEGVPLSGIAAITFTEKAAADLRRRLRVELEKKRETEGDSPAGVLVSAALDTLDAAPIGTIHSFARRLLTENPIEARVPPGFEVRSDLATTIDRRSLWQGQRQELFRDPRLRPHVEPLLDLGVREDAFEELSATFDAYWDRLLAYHPTVSPQKAFQELNGVVSDLVQLSEQCLKPDQDKLAAEIRVLAQMMDTLHQTPEGDIRKRAALLTGCPTIHTKTGAKPHWPGDLLDRGRLLGARAKELASAAFLEVIDAHVVAVLDYFRTMSLERATRRRLEGSLDFQDLLVLARNLLQSDASTWASLAKRYPWIIVDEFQDTDPLQADIVCRLAATSFDPHKHWSALELRPGALVTVGDPKQSIYRFRGADIHTYFTHRDRDAGASGQESVELTTNFRSTGPLLDWVNAAFNTLIQPSGRVQPEFTALNRAPLQDQAPVLEGPSVLALGTSAPADKAADSRAREAQDIADAVLEAIGCVSGRPGWTKQVRGDSVVNTPVTLSDICILIPSRTSLPPLEAALRAANIEFVSEASSVVYSTVEVQALLFALRFIANPADQGSLVLALRSPLFGIGDDELLEWKVSGGGWSVFGKKVHADSPSAVGRALATLQRLVFAVPTLSPSDALDALVADCFFYEKALFAGAGRRAWWRRVRYVIDQAEAWYQTTGGSLRDYLAWAAIQQDEKTRVVEAITPDIGDDALHIMTVHMAKGLEFPVVMLAGGMSGPKNDRPTVLWDDGGRPHVFLAKADKDEFSVRTHNYSDVFAQEKNAREMEYRRLYYVACTRAESHLVVSRHRHKRTPAGAFASYLAETEQATEGLVAEWEAIVGDVHLPEPSPAADPAPTVDVTQWHEQHLHMTDCASFPRSLSVTALAHDRRSSRAREFFAGLGIGSPPPGQTGEESFDASQAAAEERGEQVSPVKKGVRFVPREDLEQSKSPPDSRGVPAGGADSVAALASGGPAFGTALHWVMEVSDLTPGNQIPGLVARAAERFGVSDKAVLAAAVEAALANATVVHAREHRHWLELPLAIFQADVVVEGIADLVYEEDDGSLVVVDFKTDRVLDEATLGEYWTQLQAYAVILQRVTGKPCIRCVIVHAPPGALSATSIEKQVVLHPLPEQMPKSG